MKYFDQFNSNTYAGSGNQLYFAMNENEIRTLLRDHKIKYDVKVKNLLSPSPMHVGARAHAGSLGMDLTKSYEYKIYVRKADYERALELMRKRGQ